MSIGSNPLDLTGRTILVSGASSGIGRETAIVLSELGARVILSGRDPQRLRETLEQLQGEGHRAEPFDLTEIEAIPEWIKRLTAAGPLHGLVHSAGVQQTMAIQMTNAARLEALLRTNVTAAVMLVKGFRQKGCTVPGGSVVLISSAAGLVGRPGVTAYSASKAALIGFAKSAALELAREKLRVNCVAPGYVETEMIQRLRETITEEQFASIERQHALGIGTPRDVAWAAAFLLADTGRWITGTTLVVDGGYTAY
jgi:NAD(P)-dependent dehydrogenase (short-subunit alcohol dehydrogenase family)